MSYAQSGEGDIRRNLIEADLVDCMVALPGQLFYSVPIPAFLWFVVRDRKRRGEALFIDARNLGNMVDRTHREMGQDDIALITGAYHAWRSQAPSEAAEVSPLSVTSPRTVADDHPPPVREGSNSPSALEAEGRARGKAPYVDVPGFCKSASLDELHRHGHFIADAKTLADTIEETDDD